MKKLILVLVSILFISGSMNLFAENDFVEQMAGIVEDVLSEAQKTDSLEEGENVSNGEISFFVPAGWTPVYYNTKVKGQDLLYYLSAEGNQVNIVLQRSVGDTSGFLPEDYVALLLGVMESMYDELEVIEDFGDRVIYEASLGDITIIQDIFCIFNGSNVYVFSASSTEDYYEDYVDDISKIYESVNFPK